MTTRSCGRASGAFAIGFGIQQIVQPLRVLEQQGREFGWGRPEALGQPVGGIAEIQHLQAELRHMAQRLAEAHQNLRGYLGDLTAGRKTSGRWRASYTTGRFNCSWRSTSACNGKKTGVRALFTTDGLARRFPPEQEITIYRIV